MPDSGYVSDDRQDFECPEPRDRLLRDPNEEPKREELPAQEPRGQLASRILAMPSDTNPKGDIFGGWIMSLMDMAGKMSATTVAAGRVVTVAVDRIVFRQPVNVGDVVCCYTDVLRTGRSSITLSIEVWAKRQGQGTRVMVTDAVFTFVAIDDDGRPRPLAPPPTETLPPHAPEASLY